MCTCRKMPKRVTPQAITNCGLGWKLGHKEVYNRKLLLILHAILNYLVFSKVSLHYYIFI